ncbi:MAG: sigma-70 family RNA polymerase sigma factor [Bdellovibrio sp.]
MIPNRAADFEKFYEAHADKVRGLLFRLVGSEVLSDLTQEVFMKAWQHRDDFRGESHASTWLYRVAYNCAIDFLRKAGERSAPGKFWQNSLEKEVSHRQIVEMLLLELSWDHRTVVVLYYFEERPVREIGEILSIAEGTVKSRLSQARQKMTELLKMKGVEL